MALLVFLLSVRLSKRDRTGRDERVPRLSLGSGESVVIVARPSRSLSVFKYFVTLGLYGIWRKRHTYVVTDRRLVIGRGVVARTERSIPMNRIEDVLYVRKGPGAYCEVAATSHGRRVTSALGPFSARKARRLAAEIQART